VAITVGDAVLAVQTASGAYVEGRWPDVMWPLGALLIAAAGLERTPSRPVAALAGWRSFAVPAVFVIIAAVLQVLDAPLDFPLAVDILISATFLLVLMRAGLALRDNQRLLERSRAEATTDSLTGLGNRRALSADLGDALAGGGEWTLALFDLDGFKAYNDTFGHDAGDALLSRLGLALESTVSPGRAYRFGGDEFCVLTPLTGPRAERVLTAADDALSERGDGFRVGASRGTARLPAEAADPASALRLVDQRMYVHKTPRRTVSGAPEGVAGAFRAVVGADGARGPATATSA
jgi:diguanylate cyclase (GGDEF)-like protein